MGRPPLPDEEKRNKPIRVLVTADEFNRIVALAGGRGKVSSWMRRIALGERGQAVIEMAFIAPLLLGLLALAVTGGQLINASVALAQAARAGAIAAQAAYVQGTNQTTAAENAESLDLGSAYSSVTTVVSDPTNAQTGQVMVQVSLTETVRPLFAWFTVMPIRAQAEEGS